MAEEDRGVLSEPPCEADLLAEELTGSPAELSSAFGAGLFGDSNDENTRSAETAGEEDETPPWLEDSVQRVSRILAQERLNPRSHCSWSILLAVFAVLTLGVNIYVARQSADAAGAASRAADAASGAAAAASRASAPPSSALLIPSWGVSAGSGACDPGDPASSSGYLAWAQSLMHQSASRGDQYLFAASKCASTLESVQVKNRELESALQQARQSLAATQTALREREEALLAKELALSRLEDAFSLGEQQRRTESACCRSELKARGRAEENAAQCTRRLYRCEERERRQEEQAQQQELLRQRQQQQANLQAAQQMGGGGSQRARYRSLYTVFG